jgi:Asp-tRNA(Asn)/Glu-tRNA(Gln) amidotransferase A subunit family amidase
MPKRALLPLGKGWGLNRCAQLHANALENVGFQSLSLQGDRYATRPVRVWDGGGACRSVLCERASDNKPGRSITREWLVACMGDADMVHIPTIPVPVPSISESTAGSPAEVAATIGRLTHCTRAINYLGLPSIAVPSGFSSSAMPMSFQLVGRLYSEPILLRAADAYQRRTGWHTQRRHWPRHRSARRDTQRFQDYFSSGRYRACH